MEFRCLNEKLLTDAEKSCFLIIAQIPFTRFYMRRSQLVDAWELKNYAAQKHEKSTTKNSFHLCLFILLNVYGANRKSSKAF
jgi:hypothetical protein